MKSTVLIRPMFTRLSFPMSLVRQGSEPSIPMSQTNLEGLTPSISFDEIGQRLIYLDGLCFSNTIIYIDNFLLAEGYQYPQTAEVLAAIDSLYSRNNSISWPQ